MSGAAGYRWVNIRCSPAALEAGWYELSIAGGEGSKEWGADRIRSSDGREQPVALSSSALGERSIILFLNGITEAQLRVNGDHDVATSRLVCRRIGRIQAFGVMLRSIARIADGGVRVAGVALVEFFWAAAVYGLSVGAEGMYLRYQAAIASDTLTASPPEQVWRLRRNAWRLRSDRLKLTQVPEAAKQGKTQFAITRMDDATSILQAGWYRLTGRLNVSQGSVVAPRFELNYASAGVRPFPVQIPIRTPEANDRFDTLVLFTRDVTALRFDLSSEPLRVAMHDFELRRMGRLEWTMRLLGGLRNGDGRRDWTGILRTATGMFSLVVRGETRAAGEFLVGRYLGSGNRHEISYRSWIRRYDAISPAHREDMERRGVQVAVDGPLISILVPVYQTPERWLRACLDSVLAQAYPKWELCIADDASPDPRIRELLTEYQQRDERVRVVFRELNGHISEASNTALAMARGDYVGLLDHDDELRPHALLEVAEAIAARPGLHLVYSDEDKINAEGRRFHPYFKPDWNPDLLLSQNYVCHFTVISAALMRSVGGFRRGFEGSQDHDLVLRCTRGLKPEEIHHVPKVLYHWRAIAGSTALERDSKDYAAAAGARAVSEYVRAVDPHARVEELSHGHYRVHWHVPEPAPKVSIIIPTRDRADLLRTCVESVLAKTRYPDFELVVIDNQSSEPEALAYLDALRGRDGIRVLVYDAQFNYSAINNWAVGQCDGTLVCLLNNDIEVINEDWLVDMAGFACRPDTGAVGAMLYYPDDTIQHAGVILGVGGVANHAYCHEPEGYPGHGARALVAQNLSAVTGACLLVRKELYEQVGGLDERLQVAFNDIDFCLKLKEAGYRNVWTPFAKMYHHESASRGVDDTDEKATRFFGEVSLMRQRWAEVLDNDPAYNPNLSLSIGDTSSQLAFPPRLGHRPPPGRRSVGADPIAEVEAEIRHAVAQAGAREGHWRKAGEGVDVVLFWKQNDSTLYGRRSDMVARYLASRRDVRTVMVVDAPVSDTRLASFAAGDRIDQQRWIYNRTLEKLRGTRDSGSIVHEVFVYSSSRFAPNAHEQARPDFIEAYARFLANRFERKGVDPGRSVFWIYPRDFCMPALLKRFEPARTVVDVVDDHRAWPDVSPADNARFGENYRSLLARADLALANCETVRVAMCEYHDRVHLIPNGCDEAPMASPGKDELAAVNELIQEMETRPGKVIGFVGNLEPKIDIQLLDAVARRFPEHLLVLVGSTHANPGVRVLLRHPNVRMPGVVPYDQLGDCLTCFDVGLIPHLDMRLTRHMNPLKAYVYLSFDVPVVSTAVANVDPDCELVRVASDHRTFLEQIECVLAESRPSTERFGAYVSTNSWRARLGDAVDGLQLGSGI